MLGGVAAGWLRAALAYYGHLKLPWLPFSPPQPGQCSQGRDQAGGGHGISQPEVAVVGSVLSQLLGTNTQHIPRGAQSPNPGRSQSSPCLLLLHILAAHSCPPLAPSPHLPPSSPSQEGTSIPGKAAGGAAEMLFHSCSCRNLRPPQQQQHHSRGWETGAALCKRGEGTLVQEAPCASPGHLSRAQEQVPAPLTPQGHGGLWWLHCDTLNAPGAAKPVTRAGTDTGAENRLKH